jgi:hypothetical protein
MVQDAEKTIAFLNQVHVRKLREVTVLKMSEEMQLI